MDDVDVLTAEVDEAIARTMAKADKTVPLLEGLDQILSARLERSRTSGIPWLAPHPEHEGDLMVVERYSLDHDPDDPEAIRVTVEGTPWPPFRVTVDLELPEPEEPE